MKNYQIVLNGLSRDNEEVDHVQGRMSRSTSLMFSKGTAVFAVIALLSVVSLAGIVASVVTTARDGYRRLPKETFALTV
jgi:hypothetical protein